MCIQPVKSEREEQLGVLVTMDTTDTLHVRQGVWTHRQLDHFNRLFK